MARYSPLKKWQLRTGVRQQALALATQLGVSTIVGQILLNRGITSPTAAKQFFAGQLTDLFDPFLLAGMTTAVERILSALRQNEQITIYGDYDVDGITATALLVRVLRRLGANVDYYIPNRTDEGYGLHHQALCTLADNGTKLVITVDCGITADQTTITVPGLDLIITDHHQPPAVLPQVLAIINPKQPVCSYPEQELAGVGVAFKLCQALLLKLKVDWNCAEYLDLVAIGTIADVVPLTGENRIIVKFGLQKLQQTKNLGLQALVGVCELVPQDINATKVAFVLAPRLNASGRISDAGAGVELLTGTDVQLNQELAQKMNLINLERQAIEQQILEQAEAMLANTNWQTTKAVVLASEQWHPGVIGIVASRLIERYHRPTVLIAINDNVGKGSCRSIPNFDMYQALQQCSDCLLQFGGHHQAAGLSIQPERIDEFRASLNELASRLLTAEDLLPVLKIDTTVALDEINAALVEQLAALEPFGMGNPSPLLASSPVEIVSAAAFGKENRHLRFCVRDHKVNIDGIAWNKGELVAQFTRGQAAAVAFVPEINEWQGRRTLRIRTLDIQPKGAYPDKTLIGKLYLLLRGLANAGDTDNLWVHNWSWLTVALTRHYAAVMQETEFLFALTVLTELNLIKLEQQPAGTKIIVLPPPANKLDITVSATYRQQHL